jgi:hypothetical protein
MSEHLPDWAEDMYIYECIITKKMIPLEGKFLILQDSRETGDCIISQYVAEWLELDQINWFEKWKDNDEWNKMSIRCQKKELIRFFSDEVKL